MKTNLVKLALAGLFATTLLVTPTLRAADTDTNAPAAESPKPKKHSLTPFHGKLVSVDTNAMTFVVGKRTFAVTSETRITKDGKPATLADGVVGENAGGAYKKGDGETLNATVVNFGGKAEKPKKEKEEKSEMN